MGIDTAFGAGSSGAVGDAHLKNIYDLLNALDYFVGGPLQVPTGGFPSIILRRDTPTPLTGVIDDDYTMLISDVNGRLHTQDGSTAAILAKLLTAPATEAKQDIQETSLDAIQVASESVDANLFDATTDTILLAIEKAEDSAHTTGDKGIQTLAVRKAAPIDLSGADGDYEPLQVDEGQLWVRTKSDSGGDLQEMKEMLEYIRTAIEKIDDYEDADFPDHARVISPLMTTDTLYISSDAGTDTIAAPGDGHHLEVFGFIITGRREDGSILINADMNLGFLTSGVSLFHKHFPTDAGGVNVENDIQVNMSGIRIAGGNNEALTLTNYSYTGVSAIQIDVTVFYKDITD